MIIKNFYITMFVVMLLVTFFHSNHLWAWTPNTSRQIVTDATMLLPETLRGLIIIYWQDVATALVEQSALKYRSDNPRQLYKSGSDGSASKLIAEEVYRSMRMIQKRKSFTRVFALFGKIAYITSESLNPLNTANTDPREDHYYAAFEKFIEQSSPHFRINFTGYTLIPLEKKTIRSELQRRFTKMGRFYPVLTTEYNQRITAGEPFTFGYQSIPFGVGMLSYSEAVNTVVDLWCSIWKAAGGELKNPPFDIQH